MSTRFTISNTALKDLHSLQRKPLGDERGYLERLFCTEELQAILSGKHIMQINHTFTKKKGTVRGLHYQHPPHAETKLVMCLQGEVFDVALDLRHNSPTFLQWHGELLSADNHKTLHIPEGFAHGFQTLTDNCELIYLHTAAYNAEAEDALNAQDPRLAINWPLEITELSSRDLNHPLINQNYQGISL